jgi:hypothetical protein
MTETWPQYDVTILDDAKIIENPAGNVIWAQADHPHVAIIRIRTKLEIVVPVPKQLAEQNNDADNLRPYIIDELHRRLDDDKPRHDMTDEPEPTKLQIAPDPTPEPGSEPADLHEGPLDDDDDARYLDPVDPRRRDAEQRRGRRFDDDDEKT